MRWLAMVNGATASASGTIELATRLGKQLSDLRFAARNQFDRVKNGPRALPERSSPVPIRWVPANVLPVCHDNDPHLALRFGEIVHISRRTARRVPRAIAPVAGVTLASADAQQHLSSRHPWARGLSPAGFAADIEVAPPVPPEEALDYLNGLGKLWRETDDAERRQLALALFVRSAPLRTRGRPCTIFDTRLTHESLRLRSRTTQSAGTCVGTPGAYNDPGTAVMTGIAVATFTRTCGRRQRTWR